ncbi:TonB-dependent receptor [Marinimicrobium sp. C2-29]|uniref:TonB-dependent receptor n=1 Tax=Marinimicrobium sp. C2-29 TaxID=3139825 RepID=UPI003139C7D2
MNKNVIALFTPILFWATPADAESPALGAANQFNIPKQRADVALTEFARQSNMTVIVPYDKVVGIETAELKGRYSLVDAAISLLEGTGLQLSFSNNGQLFIRTDEDVKGNHSMLQKNKLSGAVLLAMSSLAGAQAIAQDTSAGTLEEVLVTGIRGSLNRAQDLKRDADTVMDVIAAEDIGKFPDANVAESLQRITGVAISRNRGQGQQVTVRGMGPEYNSVRFNDRTLATDNQGREFNFDVIAAELISGAEVIKSPTASMQEGSIGATINIKTARPLSLDPITAVGSIHAIQDDLADNTGTKMSGLFSKQFRDGTLGALASIAYYNSDFRADLMSSNGWELRDTDGDDSPDAWGQRNISYQVREGNRERLGATFALEWEPNEQWHAVLDGLYSKFELEDGHIGTWTPMQDGPYEDEVVQGENILSFTTLNQRVDSVQGNDPRATDTVQLGFNLGFSPTDSFTLETDISFSEAELDSRGMGGFFSVTGYVSPEAYYDGSFTLPSVLHSQDTSDASLYRGHFMEKSADGVLDTVYEFKTDATWEIDQGILTSFEAGVAATARDKEIRRWSSVDGCAAPCGYVTDIPDELIGDVYDPGDFFSEEGGNFPRAFRNYDVPGLFGYLEDVTGVSYDPVLKPGESAKVRENTLGGYIQGNFAGDFGDIPWSGNLGIRAVKTDQVSAGETTTILSFREVFPDNEITTETGPTEIANEYSDILPSANISMDLKPDLTLRLAAAEVMTRPTLTSLSTATNINARAGVQTIDTGNPELAPFRASQFDASLEWYPDDNSSYTLAYFYKDIESFVSNTTLPVDVFGSTFFETKPRNGEGADVSGWELAGTHSFTYLPGILGGIGVQANVTVVDSSAKFSPELSSDTYQVEGLSDLSYNFILFYDQGPIQARVAYNNRSEYLFSSFNEQNEPELRDDYGQVDMSASYDITDNLTLTMEGSNLTNERLLTYQRAISRPVAMEYNGRQLTFGARYRF